MVSRKDKELANRIFSVLDKLKVCDGINDITYTIYSTLGYLRFKGDLKQIIYAEVETNYQNFNDVIRVHLEYILFSK